MFIISDNDKQLLILFYKYINEINYEQINYDIICTELYHKLSHFFKDKINSEEYIEILKQKETDYPDTNKCDKKKFTSYTHSSDTNKTDKDPLTEILEKYMNGIKINQFINIMDYTYENLLINLNYIIKFYGLDFSKILRELNTNTISTGGAGDSAWTTVTKPKAKPTESKPKSGFSSYLPKPSESKKIESIYLTKKIKFLNSKLIGCDSQHKFTEVLPSKEDILKSLDIKELELSDEYIKLSYIIIFLVLLSQNINIFYDSILELKLFYYINKYVSKYMEYKSPFMSSYKIKDDRKIDVLGYKKVKQFTLTEAGILLYLISMQSSLKYNTIEQIIDTLEIQHYKQELELTENEGLIEWRKKEMKDPFITNLGNIELTIINNFLKSKIPIEYLLNIIDINSISEEKKVLVLFIQEFTKELKLWLIQTIIFTTINNYFNNQYLKKKDIDEFINKIYTIFKIEIEKYDLKTYKEHDKIFPYLVVYYLLLILRGRIYELICRIFTYKNMIKHCDEIFKNHLHVIINIFEFLKVLSPPDILIINQIFEDNKKETYDNIEFEQIKTKTYYQKYLKYKIKYLNLINNHIN